MLYPLTFQIFLYLGHEGMQLDQFVFVHGNNLRLTPSSQHCCYSAVYQRDSNKTIIAGTRIPGYFIYALLFICY
jgi:hypothetical protein